MGSILVCIMPLEYEKYFDLMFVFLLFIFTIT
jgi:hypothetical protein